MVTVIVGMGVGASTAVAETHPFLFSFGSLADPNGIAVDESTGDVYVADIGANTISKFDANGNPVEFSAFHSNVLSGTATPAGSLSFPSVSGTPAAIAVDNSTSASDPSRGDLYVMDAGHDVIDKFSPDGTYLSQITGPFEEGLVGLALTANGDLHVAVRVTSSQSWETLHEDIDTFDNATINTLLKQQQGGNENPPYDASIVHQSPEDSFAASATGDYYTLFGCGCAEKFGQALSGLGRVDSGPGDVAMAVDPVSAHLYVDDQSSVVEWDTGGLNGYDHPADAQEDVGTGAEVSSFGSLQLSASPVPQGGIAVNGSSGEIYVSNPADGKVYAFGSDTPDVAAAAATNVTQTGATLQGSIDPRGGPVTSCEFEYEKAPKGGLGVAGDQHEFAVPVTAFAHRTDCAQAGSQIGLGTSPVGVSVDIGGLMPGTLYYFRLLAGNATGTSSSEGLVATADAGFGIQSFSVSFLNKDGTSDTQAGSHPYEMVTTFVFNTKAVPRIPYADSPYELRPVDNAKDIIVTLPPGLVGDPEATAKKCTLSELDAGNWDNPELEFNTECPPEAKVGELYLETLGYGTGSYTLNNMVPPRGVAAQLGARTFFPEAFINVGPQAGGQYPLRAESLDIPAVAPLYRVRVAMSGVLGSGESRKPFLTLPSGCSGPLWSSISVDSYQAPGHYVGTSEPTRNASGEPVRMTGCSKLTFPTAITVAPDVSNASSSSGLTVGVHVPQTAGLNPEGLGESTLRDTTVALPAGVTLNPAGAEGLQSCSESQAGFAGFTEFNSEFEPGVQWATFSPEAIGSLQPGVNFCPNSSKIGTVKIKTPLLPNALEGAVYLAAQSENPFGSLVAMYMMVEDPVSGSTVKLAGEVRLCENTGEVLDNVTCQAPGQIITTFKNTPDLPFEELELHFFGGERAPLSTPSRCGTYTTQASFTPWDGNSPVESSSSFQIEHGPNGGPCPGASLPFNPSLTAGTTSIQAGGFSPFTMTMSRADGQQNLQAIDLTMPPGLSGLLAGVKLCGEAEANAGTCGPESQIGETIVSVGVGGSPFSVTGGKVYITGPYHGAPFGLSIVNPANAGPFHLGSVIVRAKIEVNPITAALTITSDNTGPYKIPTMLDGIPLQIQHVNVTINRPGFTFNPTNCSPMAITGSLDSTEGATDALSVPFQATNCAALGFAPKFAVSTSGKTSRTDGASLSVKLTYPTAPLGSQANIKQVKVELPEQLPSRLPTLQKACTAAQFEANPAGCPSASIVGHAKAITPLVPVPLEGPAYFVSHGGEGWPALVVVLQGYGVTIDLVGTTFISKSGVTSTTFKTVPDQPVTSFELTLPKGPYSALTALGNLCTATKTVTIKKKVTVKVHGRKKTITRKVKQRESATLQMPTEFVAQNGAEIHQTTPIAVTGCPKKAAGLKKARGGRGKR
jgi:DNA-binding beta-propeller fold protein YncE